MTGGVINVLQISGASNLGDWPVTGERVDTSTHSDVEEDIYEVEKSYTEDFSPVRKVDLLVAEFGEEQSVKTYIVPPPLICVYPSSTCYELPNALIT